MAAPIWPWAEAETDAVWLACAGDGTGGFGPSTRLAIDARQRLVAVGDFDGTGCDQAVADQLPSGVTPCLATGQVTSALAPRPQTVPACLPVVLGLRPGRSGRSGHGDGVEHYVTIVLGDAHGEARSTTALRVGAAPTALALGDFNFFRRWVVDLVLGLPRQR